MKNNGLRVSFILTLLITFLSISFIASAQSVTIKSTGNAWAKQEGTKISYGCDGKHSGECTITITGFTPK